MGLASLATLTQKLCPDDKHLCGSGPESRKEVEADIYLQTMLCAASSHDSLTSLASGWQFRPWHMEPVRFTKGSVLSHQPSAGLLGEIPRSAQVSSSEVTMEGLDQLPVLSTCTVVQALVSPPTNYLVHSLSQLFTVRPRAVKYTMYMMDLGTA